LRLSDVINTLGLKPVYKEYNVGGHEVIEKGYADIEMFISTILSGFS